MTCQWRVRKNRGLDRPAAQQRRRGACIALTAAALLAALPHGGALAADWLDDTLRGSLTPSSSVRWDGINLGVQVGLTGMNTDFGSSTTGQVAHILRNSTLENEAHPSAWTTLPTDYTNGRSYGAFLGYSTQSDQLVLGFDLGYNRPSSVESKANDTLTRIVTTSDSVQHTVTITAQSSMKLIDYATARFRAGYAFGQFMPYAFAGGAVGRFNYTNSSTVTSIEDPAGAPPPTTFGPVTESSGKSNAIVGGFTAGLGMDVALLPNVFLRAEWEYVGFAQTSGIRSTISTGRVGIGMRF